MCATNVIGAKQKYHLALGQRLVSFILTKLSQYCIGGVGFLQITIDCWFLFLGREEEGYSLLLSVLSGSL